MSKPLSSGRNLVMDALRGLASMYVAIFHFNEMIPYKSNYWQAFCKQGWLGVPVFFVISGWCMAMIVPREKSALAFIVKRLMRIFPPYWLSLGVVMAVVTWRVLGTGTNDIIGLPKNVPSLLATLTLFTHPASTVPAINWVYWSLTYEVGFYLLIYIGMVLRRPSLFLIALLPLSLLEVASIHDNFFERLLFFTDQYPLFLLGFFGYGFKWKARSIGLIGLLVGISFFTIQWLPVTVAVLTFVILIWSESGLQSITGWLLPLAKVGDWSYSLYLIHVPIGCYILIRFRTERMLQHTFLHMSYDLAALAVCVAIAWLIHVLVEQPSHQLGKWMAARL